MENFFNKLTQKVWGVLLIIWFIFFGIGISKIGTSLLSGKTIVSEIPCIESEVDSRGYTCIEYAENSVNSTYQEQIVDSIWVASIATLGFAFLFLLCKIPEKIKQVKFKRAWKKEQDYYNDE